jgi:SAM-dependent methyltransferase
MLLSKRNNVTPGFASGVRPDGNATPMERPFETEPASALWDGRFERGYGELMERECERARYQAIGQLVAALPAHSSLLDVGCGIGTLSDYLPALDYTGIDVSQKALVIAQNRHPGTFICSDAESFFADKKFDVILFNETLYYLDDPLEQLARYREFLSDGGSMVVSIWLPDSMHPNRVRHVRLIREIISSDVFAQSPMDIREIEEAALRWKVIRIGMPG